MRCALRSRTLNGAAAQCTKVYFHCAMSWELPRSRLILQRLGKVNGLINSESDCTEQQTMQSTFELILLKMVDWPFLAFII